MKPDAPPTSPPRSPQGRRVIPRYAEFAPRADLAGHVHCLWLFEGDDGGEDQRIAPDGRCELIVHHGRPYLERTADGGAFRQAPAVFAGQLTRPLHLRGDGPAGVIGVRFRPAGALAYAGGPLSAFTDRRAPLDELAGPGAAQALAAGLAGLDEAGRLARVQDHVAARLAAGPPRDLAVEAAVARLQAGEGAEGLAAAAGLAARMLQRRFARAVGVSPRLLAAVFRFRRVFDALAEASVETWTDAAQAAGYFDHPQMARDFRRFVGCTPSQFVAARAGLASSLVEA
jgi:AraC-like DNA-binding protein